MGFRTYGLIYDDLLKRLARRRRRRRADADGTPGMRLLCSDDPPSCPGRLPARRDIAADARCAGRCLNSIDGRGSSRGTRKTSSRTRGI